MQNKKIKYLLSGIELILFILTTGLLAYLSGKGEWIYFFIFFGLSVLLYIILKFFELKPIVNYFNKLEKKEFYFNTRLSKNGVVDFFNLSDLEENLQKIDELKKCFQSTSLVKYSGLTGFMLINRDTKLLYDEMINFLETGKLLKLIIADPESESIKLRNKIHNINASNLTLNYAKELNNKYESLNIRVSRHSIYGSVFITNDIAFFDPYHLGKNNNSIKNRFFSIKTSKSKGEYYDIVDSHFENLWNNSVALEDYLK